MRYDTDQLYHLLPQIYRIRDAKEGGLALRALVGVLAREANVLEADIARLYDNAFIETCDEWVIPYIADLLGVRNLLQVPGAAFSARARVANTIAFRRRKGTATMLEQLARDTTGWPAHAVEFFARLETTQWLNHLRPANLRTPDLRDADALELVDGPFDSAAHTADVRRIARGRGRHNIPNIGLFLWRLQSYPVAAGTACALATPGDGRYTFHPLGLDAPLFHIPQTEREITHLAEEINVPSPLRRRPLYAELEARRQALVDGALHRPLWFGARPPFALAVRETAGAQLRIVPAEEILICDLSEPPVAIPDVWRRPPTAKAYKPAGGGQEVNRIITCAVDPVRGRLAFPSGVTPAEVRVDYAYGFPGDLGGGPYNRRDSLSARLVRQPTWQAGVAADASAVGGEPLFTSLAAAVQAWNSQPAGTAGLIVVMDSLTREADLTTAANRIRVPAGSHLSIAAAGWPVTTGDGGVPQRVAGDWFADGLRTVFHGDWEVAGGTLGEGQVGGSFAIDGLLIDGRLSVVRGELGELALAHTTLVPGKGGLDVAAGNDAIRVGIQRCVIAEIDCRAEAAGIAVRESALAGPIDAAKSHLEAQGATLLGSVKTRSLDAGNSLFLANVAVERRQEGCVRFCFVPDKSDTPRRHRCQPDLALAQPQAVKTQVLARVRPQFTSLVWGDAAYLQLAATCASEISGGAEDGGEMGAWHFLMNGARAANLGASLDEYLRVGLEAGVFFVS